MAGLLTSFVLRLGVDAQVLLVAAGVVVPFLYLPAARALLPDGAQVKPDAEAPAGGRAVSLRWGLVALLGLAAFAGHLSEGRRSTGPRCTPGGNCSPIRPPRPWPTPCSRWP